MKKLRLFLMFLAIVISVGTAVAFTDGFTCTYSTQYVYTGGTYQEAGMYGVDYTCLNFPLTCTYYKPSPVFQPGKYAPCRSGYYVVIN